MVKENELRIGNWVDVNGYAEVRGVTRGGVWIRNQAFAITEWKGIPLTPKLLVKCGFEECEGIWWEHQTESIFMVLSGEVYFGEVLQIDSPKICNHVKYVHQLQNLYFALTGEELSIDLTA
jgi:hypothetical protein